jgi:transposase
MAGKTKEMSQIKQMLLLSQQGVSNRKIAMSLGLNKETVNNYMRKVNADSMCIKELLQLDDPALEHRIKGGSPAYTDERFVKFKGMIPYLEAEMSSKHVTLQLLWEEYRQDNPGGYSLTQFRFHYRQNVKAGKDSSPSTILKDTFVGGEKIFLDFAGDTLSYVDIETGELIQVQSFVASLPASDYGFMLCVPSQRTEDFVHAVIQCFKAIGGVPRILVPDNLKAAVVKTDRYEPVINKVMENMANHYGAVVIPARPLHPKDKSLVEDQVKIVYRRIYAELRNRIFYSLDELNRAVAEKMKAHNQKRMQQHPYSREERFLAVDKPGLLPLPDTDFEIKYYADLKIEQNCCIYLGRDRHHYTVPYRYIGQQAHVIYTRTMVKVYVGGVQVAVHARDHAPGGYTIIKEHLASNSRAYRERSPQYYMDRADKVSSELGCVIREIFYSSKMPPETHYRVCDALLSMQRRTAPDIFNKACETAALWNRPSLKFITSMVESKCAAVGQMTAPCAPPPHGNIRGRSEFE